MKIDELKELEDGSCELDCEFTEEEIKILLNYAVNNLLKEKMEELKNGK